MGQKTNPNILRLGSIKQWKSKYIEKKSSEYAIYTFYDFEIQQFIQKFLNDNGLILHNCQTRYFENSLHIYLSYYITEEFYISIKKKEIHLKPKSKKIFLTKQFRRKYFNLKQKTKNYFKYTKTIQRFQTKKFFKQYNLKNLVKKTNIINRKIKYVLKNKRNKFIPYYKLAFTKKQQNQTLKNIQISSFWNKVAETIQLFIGNSINIVLQFKQLTKPTLSKITDKQIKMLKKIIGQLRKYKQNKFFKQGINLIFMFVTTNNSSNLLATFIAEELKKQKRHNFFLSFIKTTIKLFNLHNIGDLKGIKIKIKGRLNGSPRAKHRIINIGKGVPIFTIQSNINYSEAVAYTPNGTFGVKIWTSS